MSSRRSSRLSDTGGEIFLECKAAFLSIYDDINDKVESKKRLNSLLQQSGRNPTKSALDKYWPRNTDELSFNDFVDICRKEPVTSADDLMKAFRKIDINGDGYISLDELYKIMNAQGETMTREDVKKMIDEVDDNKDGRLDYGEFTNMIMKTTEESKKFSMKVMEKKERKKKRAEKLRNSEAEPDATSLKSHDLHVHNDTPGSPKRDSPKASPRSRSDSLPKNTLKRGTPREHTLKDSGTKETPRREHSARHEKPPLPDSPKTPKDSGADKGKATKHEKMETPKTGADKGHIPFKLDLPIDSARSVGEEIDYDDDFDIVSTGRPTPRIDLNASRAETPRKDSTHTKEGAKGKDEEKSITADKKDSKDLKESSKDVKGNSSNKVVDSNALASTAKRDNKTDDKVKAAGDDNYDKERSSKEQSEKKQDGSDRRKSLQNGKHEDLSVSNKAERTGTKFDETEYLLKPGKASESENSMSRKHKDESTKSKKVEESTRPSSLDFVDEIFKSRRNSRRLLEKEFEIIADDMSTDEPPKRKIDTEENLKESKAIKSSESTPKVAPRKDKKDTKTPGRNENGLGSQTSIRSGDKEISGPVPSPRKSVSRVSEDDVPKPSPRVKGVKGKSSSTKSRDKMPDPKSLQDWMHYTSKGCFFYEEEEIVTHIYSLKLTEDSSVYLSAHPIQEPASLDLPGTEPIDTALYLFDSRGKFVTCTENRDTKGTYGVKCDLSAGEYQVLPYTTGCRFKQRPESLQEKMKESKLVKTKDDKVVITPAFRRALEEIFDLCDLDNNGTMSKDEFNWFNLRTSGEELGEDEWEVVEEKTELDNGEITKQGFIELNEMEAEDSQGDVEDLWITLTSMGMNKALIMDEACPYRVDVYVEETGRKRPSFKVTGIESLEKKEFVSEICQYIIERAGELLTQYKIYSSVENHIWATEGRVLILFSTELYILYWEEPTKIRNMKDLYMYTDKNDLKATIVIDNRSRSSVSLQVNCSRSKNVVSNRPSLDHTVELEPQSMAIAQHLLPKNELSDWTIACTENILK